MGKKKKKKLKGRNKIHFKDVQEINIIKPNHKMTDNEFGVFKYRYNRYSETLADEVAKAQGLLGYNFNKSIALNREKKIGSLMVGNAAHLQRVNIPMKESMVAELLSCKKFTVKEDTSMFESRGIIQRCFRKVLIGETVFGPVQFLAVNTQGITKSNILTKDFSTSLYCILRGKDPMFLYRHDNVARSVHLNRFDEDGELIRGKDLTIDEIKNKYKGAHEHKYSLKYCTVFSNTFLLEHCDITPAVRYKNSIEYWEEFARRFNIQSSYVFLKGDKTVQDAVNKIRALNIREKAIQTQENVTEDIFTEQLEQEKPEQINKTFKR